MKPLDEYLINRLKEIRAMSNNSLMGTDSGWPMCEIYRTADRAIKRAKKIQNTDVPYKEA